MHASRECTRYGVAGLAPQVPANLDSLIKRIL